MGDIRSFLFFVLLASSAVAGPVNFQSGPCARHCTESSKFKYQPGTTYVYQYEADTTTTLQGTTKDESRLHLRARVEIDVISKCDLIMRLKNINLEQSEPSNPRTRNRASGLENLQRSLERNPLRFSFQDGTVDVVCPSHEEEASVTNIKRGILSILQNTMSTLEGTEDVLENDVAGKCTTTYQSMGKGWNSITIKRMKDFATCTDRYNMNTAIQADIHNGMGTSTMPLVKGEQHCEQTFSSGLLQKVLCTEQHILRPFSRQSNGAVTRVAQTLTYQTFTPTTATGFDYSSTERELMFDHNKEVVEDGRREREAEMALGDLCATARPDIKASVPAKFTKVVYSFRNIDYRSLNSIFRRINQICPNNNKAKKFFLDALPMVGNVAAVRMMKEMVENGDVNKGDAETWFTTIAFLSKPTKEMIKELMPILDGRYEQALLGVSAMINTFCKNHEQCAEVTEVQQAVEKISSILGNNCNGHKKKVLLALKAIGNIGVARGVENTLRSCSYAKDTEIRMAAIDAYRRFPCDVSRDDLVKLFTEKQENVEVRIKSYLAAMKCPSSFLLETIETMLQAEQINQVGSFVWSHLMNMAKHNGPHARDIRRLTSDLYLMNKFVADIRKFSRNVDTGVFLKSIDAGFDLGGNLIFTPESYIPRSAMLNLTIDIFGHRVNLFEVEGRAEGFEQILESMFGPESSIINSHKKNLDKRLVEMENTFKAKEIYYKEPSATLDFKVFGNTLWHKKMNSGSLVREEISFMDILIELAKEQDVEISKSLMFLDTTYTVPTGCGLPLHVAINGTATVDMKVRGKFDVRSLDSVDIRGQIQPSGAVEISSIMTVDAIVAKAGIKVVATLHSSTIMDGLFEVRKGSLMRAQINMPEEQMEVINIQSKILLLNGDKEQEQMGATDRRLRMVQCSGEYTDRALGVELCGEMSLPSAQRNNIPAYPFSGPAILRVFLRKTDPTLTTYNFETKWTPENKHFTVMFNTPESKVDREISMEFHASEQDRAVSVKVRTPMKRMRLYGKYQNDENEKKMDVSLSVDDVEKFAIQAALTKDETESGMRYMPTLMVQGPVGRILNMRGVTTIRYGQKWSSEINIEDLTEKPIIIRGDISTGEKNRYEGQMSINSYLLDASVNGYAQLNNAFSSKLTVEYKFLEGQQEKFDLNAKFRDMSANSLLKYSGSGSFQSTSMPEYSTAFWWETQMTSGHIENSMELTVGDGRVRRVHKITMQEILRYNGDLYNNDVDATLKLTYPEYNIDYAFVMVHKNTPRSLNNKITVQYRPSRQLTSNVNLEFVPDPLTANGEIQITYPRRDIKVSAKINEVKPTEYEMTVTGQLQRGKQVKVVGALRNKSDRKQFHVEGNMEMTMPNTRPMSVAASVKKFQGQSIITGNVDFGRGAYGLKGEHSSPSPYNHRLSGAINVPDKIYTGEASLMTDKKFSGKMDLNLPNQRHLVGSIDVTDGLRQVDFDFMWDADRDQNRRVSVSTKYQIQRQAFHGSAIVKCPANTVRATVDADYQGRIAYGNLRTNARSELQWGQGKVISVDFTGTSSLHSSSSLVEGGLKVRSPFSGFRNLDLKLKHSKKTPEWNSEVNAEWENKKFSMSTDGKYTSDRYNHYMEGRLNVVTPFKTLERFSVEHICQSNPGAYQTNNEITWNRDKKIGFGLYGSIFKNIRAGMNFTSPFETLEQFSASATHDYTRENVKSHAEALWNNRKQITLDIDGSSSQKGRKRSCIINAKVNTPFRGYEKLSSQMAYNNDGNEVSGDAEINVNFKKITVGFNGQNRNSRYGNNIEGKIFYTTPYVNYENAEMKVTHSSDNTKFSCNLEAKMPYNKWANVKVQGEYPTSGNLRASALMTSTFPGMERISSDMTYKTDGPRVEINGQATYGKKQIKIDASGFITRNKRSWELDGNLLLNTPFRGYEDNKISVKHNWQDKNTDSQIDVTIGRQRIAATHHLQYDNIYNFKNSLKVTSPYSMTFVVAHKGDNKQFRHETEMEWGKNKRATAVLELGNQSNRNKRNLNAKLDVKTTFYNFDSLTVETVYESDRDNIKPRISIEWNGYHKVNVQGDFYTPNPTLIDAKVTATSTFRNFESISLEGKMDLTQKQKIITAILQKQEIFKVLLDNTVDNGAAELSIKSFFLKGCDNLKAKGSYDLSSNQNAGTLVLACDDKSVFVVNGQLTKNVDGNGFTIKLKTPIRNMENLGVNGRYSTAHNFFSSQLNLMWANNQNIALKFENEFTRNGLKLKTTAETPFQGYESMVFELTGDSQANKKSLNTLVSYATNKDIQLIYIFETNRIDSHNVDIAFQSPFKNFENLSLKGNMEQNPNDFKTEGSFQWEPQQKIMTSLTIRLNPMESIFIVTTPFNNLRTMKIMGNLRNHENYLAVNTNCEWNDHNKIALVGSLRNNGNQFLEGKIKLDTPFHGYRTMSLDTTVKRETNQIDGKISMVTPFNSLSKIEANGQYSTGRNDRALTLNLATPNSNYVVSGNLKMHSARRMEGTLNIETPIQGMEKFSVIANFDGDNWGSLKADAMVSGDRFFHKIFASYRNINGVIEGDTKAESSYLNNQPASLKFRTDTRDAQNLEGSLEMEANNKKHSLQITNKRNRKGVESELKMRSPSIPRNELNLKMMYKRSKNMQGSIMAEMNSEKHSLEYSSNMDNKQISGKLRIQCSLLPLKTLNLEAKVGMPSDNSFEAMVQAITPTDSHSATCLIKLQPQNFEGQLTISSPMLDSSSVTIMSKLDLDPRSMEGFITFTTPRSESRMAINSRMAPNNFESTITLNTPFEPFRMMRLDGKLNTRKNQVDGSLNFQSSIESMKKFSISGKVNYGDDAIDTSVNVRLPFRNYNSIDFLGTIHKNRDWSSITPRFDISVNNNKYAIFGQYVNTDNEFTSNVGYEIDAKKKGEVNLNLKNNRNSKTMQISVVTPFRGYERYEMNLEHNVENHRHVIQVNIRDPSDRSVSVRGSALFHSILNFNVELTATTPFANLQQLSSRMQQIYRQNQLSTTFEVTTNNREKIAFNLKHNMDRVASGTISLNTPYERLPSVKIVYNFADGKNRDNKVEIEYAGRKAFMFHETKGQETNGNVRNIRFEIIPLSVKMHLNGKSLPLGSEILLKTSMGNRNMAFNTLYQSSPSQFSHSSKLTIDERSDRSISYEIRKTENSRKTREIFGRLDLPVRSFEIRGQSSPTSNGRMRNIDFYWDAARDTSKHIMINGVIDDHSNRDVKSHKMQLTISHPKLTKDIVARSEYSLSPNELKGKMSLEYSHQQQNNLVLEGRAQNLARSRRDTHYTASVTALHPATNTDLQLFGEVIDNGQEAEAQIKANYMDMNRKQNLAQLKTKIMKLKKEIEILTKFNENSRSLMGRMFNRDHEMTLALEEQNNNEAPLHSHFRFSRHHKNIDINITTADRETFHIRASMPENMLKCEVSHTDDFQKKNDVDFNLGLKENNLLFSKLNWRPEMISEAKYAILKKYSEMMRDMRRTLDSSKDVFWRETNARSSIVKRSLNHEMNGLYSDFEKEMNGLKRDYQSVKYNLNRIYRNNDFYIRDTIDALNNAANFAWQMATSAVSVPLRMVKMTQNALLASWEMAGSAASFLNKIFNSMSYLLQDASQFVSEAGNRFATYTNDILGSIFNKIAEYTVDTMMFFVEKLDQVVENYAPSLKQVYYNAIGVFDRINKIYTNLMDNMDISGLLDLYGYMTEEFIPNASDRIVNIYKSVNSHPRVIYAKDILNTAYEQSKFLVGNLGLDNLISNFLREAIDRGQEIAWGTLQNLVDQVTDVRSGINYVYEPSKGAVSMEMRLPESHNSLKDLFDLDKYSRMISQLKNKYFANDFSVWDIYYKYKNYASPSYWVPPFDTQAMITGTQHYMTFDQFHFDFAGECSYLLARDFVNGTFTVTTNYVVDGNHVVKKSLNVFTEGIKIEIDSDYKVTIDDIKVELPQVIGNLEVTREEGMIDLLDGDRYHIRCNLAHDVCTMKVSGFYFGKTGGLFGVYNYEPALDMTTPENVVAPDVEEYANSWKVGTGRCRKHNLAVHTANDEEAENMCQELFLRKDSIFRSCFKQVKPRPYMLMCMTDVAAVRGTLRKEKLCTSAAAYVAQCKFNNVFMQMPKHCVRCEKHDGSMVEAGDIVKITPSENVEAADIVFVVEEQKCNREVIRMMGKMAQSIEGNLKGKGYRNVRFAVVGFGGIMAAPHVVTADSSIFGTVRSIDSALTSITVGDGPSDIFLALRYAAGLPFRMGATKSIILSKCSPCQTDSMKADYSEMLRTMLDGDITLHLLTDHDFVTKSATRVSKAKKVFGLDRKYAYTVKDVKNSDLTGDADLLAQLRIPKDLCVPLALEVGGSFFSTQRLVDNKRGPNKKAMEVLAKRVAKTANPSECQVCECIATDYGVGKSFCQRCVSPIISHMFSDEISPMYSDNYDELSDNSEDYRDEDNVALRPAKPKVKKLRKKPKF